MRLNTFLLSSAALMASATVGLAADLPSKKAAPVDYVRVCTIGSFTGFVVPGSDTCLKVGGWMRYTAKWTEPRWTTPGNGRAANGLVQQARASLKMDARTTTEYGLLRGFYDIRVDQGGSAVIDKAYIQFAGLHAGKIQSLFDFYADDASYGDAGLGSDHSAIALGYTASFGGGFYGVISLEDPSPVRTGLTYGDKLPYYGGQRAPDLVAAVGVEQSWGAAKLSGAVHQMYTPNVVGAAGTPFAGVSTANTEYGYAIQGGVKINLPALGAGDALFLQAAYADGAVAYLGLPGTAFGSLGGGSYSSAYDFAYNKAGGLKRTTGYNVLAAFEHSWSPTFFSNVFGGYTVYDPSKQFIGGDYIAYNPAGASFVARKAEVIQVGANVAWKPVKNFQIAVEATYFDVKLNRAVTVAGAPKKSDNAWQSLLRIQRDF